MGTMSNSKPMVIWVEGLDRGEADQRLAPMTYARALGTIVFEKLCHLRDLTEAQVGHNQFAMDMAVDRLDDCHRHGCLA